MTDQGNNLDPVVKTRLVPLTPQAAFELFTRDLDAWWPLASHSVSGDVGASVAFGSAAGGSVDETAPDGSTHRWAEILGMQAPDRVVLAWHPGADAAPASQLSVRFEAHGDGCRVRITQSGWERFGTSGARHRRDYHQGWEAVLDCYVEAAAARST